MNQPTEFSMGAKIATACLAILGSVGGWLIVLMSGFHHMLGRRTRETIFVDGPAAVVMAAIMFTLSAVAVAALLQMRKAPWWGYAIACGAVLLVPAVYAFVR